MAALDAVINYSNVGFLFFHKPALSMFIYIKNLKWHGLSKTLELISLADIKMSNR